MGILVEYLLSYEDLPLVDVADATGTELKLGVGQPNRNDTSSLTVHARVESSELEDALEGSDVVGSYSVVDRQRNLSRYHVLPASDHWERFKQGFGGETEFEVLSERSSIVESIRVTPDGWVQKRRFADREDFSEYCEFWRDAGGSVSVRRVTDTETAENPSEALTDPQREALRKAHEMGYFEVPRRVSLSELADELGVSATSASERLRRGNDRLVEAFLYAY